MLAETTCLDYVSMCWLCVMGPILGLQKTLGEWPLRDYQPDHPLPEWDLGENRLPTVVGVPIGVLMRTVIALV